MKLFSFVLITVFEIHNAYSMNPCVQLQHAIQNADVVLAEKAVENQANTNSHLPIRMYPLEFVAFKASQLGVSPEDIRSLTQIARILLNHDTDVNINTGNGNTILHELAHWIDVSTALEILPLVKLLLDRGANPNITNSKGETPLNVAIFASSAFITLLLNRGADHTIKNIKKLTLLDKIKRITADKRLTQTQRAYTNGIAALLENYQTLMQATPDKNLLSQALTQGFTKIVQKILRSGVHFERDELKFNLDLAKQKYIETQDPHYQEIGRMLLQNLGLTGQETRVAQTGIEQRFDILPNEMIEYIRTFMQ